ncbi:MAG: protoporphyrinogen oxidase HemJ [Alphaproteobacteria bacterium]|nr:protoporphyrinogen oxidase HemJ [Alphaproteobacteria bacterium]
MYQFLLSCHIISFTAWMAGLFYLPRLFVYHSEVKIQAETAQIFAKMEYRLLKFIMNPAMLLTWIFGILLLLQLDNLLMWWVSLKLIAVLSLTIFHMYLGKCRKNFEAGINPKSSRFYRKINEIPTILLIIIVFLVIYKP